jgi:adenylate cyclase
MPMHRVALHRNRENSGLTTAPKPGNPFPGRKDMLQYTILIVDDMMLSREILHETLGSDYNVLAATSGEEAVEIAAGDIKPDLILLDIMMPGLDGYAVCKILKSDPKTEDIPVIFLTARSDEEDEEKGLSIGAVDYITKPISIPIVRARIKTQLELKQQRTRLEEKTEELNNALKELDVRNRFIRQTFNRYLSDDIVDQILETPEGLNLGGEKRIVTILMSDLRDFTPIGERLKAEDVLGVINIYLEVMTDIILKYKGTIAEFIGDSILVIFGAPIARPGDAQRAVACALEMQRETEAVNEKCRKLGYPAVSQGIGLNTGRVVVGNIGSKKRIKYGVVGGNVNLTSRIESFTLGGQIYISESTYEACSSLLRIESKMRVHPKGVKEAIIIYEVGGIDGDYRIQLPPKEEIKLLKLEKPLKLRYKIITGHIPFETPYDAELTKLHPQYAEIRTERFFRWRTNLQLLVFDDDGNLLTSDLYAKVIDKIEIKPVPVAQIVFTNVPPPAADLFKKLMEQNS